MHTAATCVLLWLSFSAAAADGDYCGVGDEAAFRSLPIHLNFHSGDQWRRLGHGPWVSSFE